MLIINGTTEKIQLTTSAAGGSGGVDVIVSYAERVESTGAVINRTAVVAGISTATTTDILGSPSSGSVRNAKLVTVRNKDTVTANAVTLKWTTSTGPVTAEAVKATLLVGEHMVVNDQGTVLVIDAQGNVKATPGTGRLLRVSVLSAGTTFTTGLDSSMIRVKGVGGGGGGAGCTSVAAAASAGGGGGAGAYFEKTAAVTPGTALTYAIGAGGTGWWERRQHHHHDQRHNHHCARRHGRAAGDGPHDTLGLCRRCRWCDRHQRGSERSGRTGQSGAHARHCDTDRLIWSRRYLGARRRRGRTSGRGRGQLGRRIELWLWRKRWGDRCVRGAGRRCGRRRGDHHRRVLLSRQR
jgi:hypothetical protein